MSTTKMTSEVLTGRVSIRDAFEMLDSMETRETVQLGKEGKWYTLPSLKALMTEFNALDNAASTLKITFWGGPPYREDWVFGTLHTLLVDKILNWEAENEAFDLVIELLKMRRPNSSLITRLPRLNSI